MSSRWQRERALLGENARLAFDVVRAHRLRSALVIVGVGIGVAALMSMVAVLSGVGEAIKRDVSAADRAIVYVARWDFLGGGSPDEDLFDRPFIEIDDVEALGRLCPSIAIADFYIEPSGFEMNLAYYRGQRSRPLWVVGAGKDFHEFFPGDLAQGRLLNEIDIEKRRRVCVLGHGPVPDLFPSTDPIGKRIRIGSIEYEVVGVFSERKSLGGSLSESYLGVPYTTYIKDWKERTDLSYAMLIAGDGYTTDDVIKEAHAVMRGRRGLRPGEDDDFAVISAAAVEEFVERLTGPIALVLLLISSIGLMVGGIGVMNIMLVSVTERTRELGVRRAVGATRSAVLLQILTEASLLTGAGGVIGTAVGIGVARTVSALTGIPATVTPGIIILAVLFSMSVGIICGLYPAAKASRMQPTEALRA